MSQRVCVSVTSPVPYISAILHRYLVRHWIWNMGYCYITQFIQFHLASSSSFQTLDASPIFSHDIHQYDRLYKVCVCGISPASGYKKNALRSWTPWPAKRRSLLCTDKLWGYPRRAQLLLNNRTVKQITNTVIYNFLTCASLVKFYFCVVHLAFVYLCFKEMFISSTFYF